MLSLTMCGYEVLLGYEHGFQRFASWQNSNHKCHLYALLRWYDAMDVPSIRSIQLDVQSSYARQVTHASSTEMEDGCI
jgi:hypothetical protein